MATLEDLEARTAATEAGRADYQAVLAAVGGLREQNVNAAAQSKTLHDTAERLAVKTDANRETINALGERLAGFQTETRRALESVNGRIDGLNATVKAGFRAHQETRQELKDLLVRALDKP